MEGTHCERFNARRHSSTRSFCFAWSIIAIVGGMAAAASADVPVHEDPSAEARSGSFSAVRPLRIEVERSQEDAASGEAESIDPILTRTALEKEPDRSDRQSLPLGPRFPSGEAESAPLLADGEGASSAMSELVRIGGGLGAVLLLIMVLRIWLRAAGVGAVASGRPSGVLEILARYPIARGQTLLVIRFGRRIVLTHQSGGTMTTVSELTDVNEVAQMLSRLEAGASGRDALRFRSLLERFEREHEQVDAEVTAQVPASRPFGHAASTVEVVDLTRGGKRRTTTAAGRGAA